MKPIKDKFLLPFLLPMCLFSTAIGEGFNRTNIQSSTPETHTQLQKYTFQESNYTLEQNNNNNNKNNNRIASYEKIETISKYHNDISHKYQLYFYFSLSLLGLAALIFCAQKKSYHLNRFLNTFRLTLFELYQRGFSFFRLKRYNQNLWGYANIHSAQFYSLTLLHP